jgi:SAM-dependent methyltransferase
MTIIFFFFFLITLPHLIALDKLSDSEIREIYETYVKINQTEEYAHRYTPFPIDKNTNPEWPWEGKDLSHVMTLFEFERFIKENKIVSKKALAINGHNNPEWDLIPHESLFITEYETDPEKYDLHTLNLPEKNFDFVAVHQTLDHVYDPLRCLKNIYEHMKSGGILYINALTVCIPHMTPFHYYTGFTPTGLGVLIKLAGFKILSIGQWGNLEYINKMFETYDFPDYRALSNPGFNQIEHPVVTWAFAQK